MLDELEEHFPQHDFLQGDPRFTDYERNILALIEEDSSKYPDPCEVREVIEYFRRTLREIEGWKPS